jgi:hypothetical protein
MPELTVHQRKYLKYRTKILEAQHRYYRRNRDKIRARHKIWCANNPDKIRAHGRKKQGILFPTGETRFGLCAICKKETNLHYDHDHATGLFRAWLCNGCNLKLGWVEKHLQEIRNILNW